MEGALVCLPRGDVEPRVGLLVCGELLQGSSRNDCDEQLAPLLLDLQGARIELQAELLEGLLEVFWGAEGRED